MNISFYLQGRKEFSSIYIRVRDTNTDAKANTKLKIDSRNFKKGVVKSIKVIPNATSAEKELIKEQNKELVKIQDKLNKVVKKVTAAYNDLEMYDCVNTVWLKNIITQKKSTVSNVLVDYFDYYAELKSTQIEKSTIKKNNAIKNRLKKYQEDMQTIVYIQNVNRQFSESLQIWCDKNGYAHNTKVKMLKVIFTMCDHAYWSGTHTSSDYRFITKGLKYKKTSHITLSFDEIQKIVDTNILDEKLDRARDWLVISCFTAQRISDNLNLKKENISVIEGNHILQFIQQKTKTAVSIYLDDEVVKILNKRDGHFPPAFAPKKGYNEIIYNELIKKVCKLAKINSIVSASFKREKPKKGESKSYFKDVPKYLAVTSHIGRRSYASNYQAFINANLLKGQTGHATEEQLNTYIRKDSVENALRLGEEMKGVKKTRNKEKEGKVVDFKVSKQG